MNLLSRTRKINRLLQQTGSNPVNFNEMSATLSEVIGANVFIVSRRGKLLGYAIMQKVENERMKKMLEERQFPEEYTNSLLELRKQQRISTLQQVHRLS